MTDRILILDYGSPSSQLIARQVRQSGVYCEILPFNAPAMQLRDFGAKGVILSSSSAQVLKKHAPAIPEAVLEQDVPILGIGYGHQVMAGQLGGRLEASGHQEPGRTFLEVSDRCRLFDELWQPGERHQVWMAQGQPVAQLPIGFRAVATAEGNAFAAIADDERRYYGLQFHPQLLHTPGGARLLEACMLKICGCAGDWTMAACREQAIAAICQTVGPQGRVVCGLSGGVDSSVAAVLIHEAIGERLTCIFVDHGLLRAGEAEQVIEVFRGHYNIPLVARDASDTFFSKLSGVRDPEEKRKIIGTTFIEIFEEEAARAGGADFLAQGTLYPDVIES